THGAHRESRRRLGSWRNGTRARRRDDVRVGACISDPYSRRAPSPRCARCEAGGRVREMTPVRVLELRSVWGTGGGPDKTILSGAAVKGNGEVETTVCYIRDARDRVFSIDQRAK